MTSRVSVLAILIPKQSSWAYLTVCFGWGLQPTKDCAAVTSEVRFISSPWCCGALCVQGSCIPVLCRFLILSVFGQRRPGRRGLGHRTQPPPSQSHTPTSLDILLYVSAATETKTSKHSTIVDRALRAGCGTRRINPAPESRICIPKPPLTPTKKDALSLTPCIRSATPLQPPPPPYLQSGRRFPGPWLRARHLLHLVPGLGLVGIRAHSIKRRPINCHELGVS